MRRTFVRGLDLREWDIVGGLLQMISSFGGRRVCDDFDFAKYVPEVEHRREVEQRFHTYNGDVFRTQICCHPPLRMLVKTFTSGAPLVKVLTNILSVVDHADAQNW